MLDAYAAERSCLAAILLMAGIGLLVGMGSGLGSFWGKWNTVMASRVARPLRRSRVPGWPRGIFFALLCASVPFLQGWCRGFAGRHPSWMLSFVACEVSTAVWLLLASFFRQGEDQERAARIARFTSDPDAYVPDPVVEFRPIWFRVWNWGNIALFMLLMMMIAKALFTLPPVG